MENPTLVILAAGTGSRFGGPKQFESLGPNGEAILDYSIFEARRAGFGKIVFVIKKDLEAIFKGKYDSINLENVEYVFQEVENIPPGFNPPARQKPWGTGHAVLTAGEKVTGSFAVINADDFYGRTSFETMRKFLAGSSPDSLDISMIGYKLINTLSEHGSVSRGVCELDERGNLSAIRERKGVREKDGEIRYESDGGGTVSSASSVSMNFWGFTPRFLDLLKTDFKKFLSEDAVEEREFYIITPVDRLIRENLGIVRVFDTPDRWFGVTFPEDKSVAKSKIRELVARGKYPAPLF